MPNGMIKMLYSGKEDIKFTEQLESITPIKVKVRGGKPTRNY